MTGVKTFDSRKRVSVGNRRARFDQGTMSYVFRGDLGKLWMMSHQRKAYWEFDTPLRLEDLVPADSRSLFAKGKQAAVTLVEVTATDDVKTFGAWQATRWEVEVLQPMLSTTRAVNLWLDTDPEMDLAPYLELRRNLSALFFLDDEWVTKVLALGGLTVFEEQKTESRHRTEVSTLILVSQKEEDVAAAHYSIPDGYVREDFDFGAVFAIEESVE